MSFQLDNTEYKNWRGRLSRANDDAFWPIEAIDEGLKTDQMQFWCNGRAALVTRIVAYPGGAVCLEAVAGTGELKAFLERMAPAVESWARAHGLSHLRVEGRLGWLKNMPQGWKAHQAIIMKELSDGAEN